MKDITLLIVDDHPLFRQGVADALALEEGFRVVGQAADGKHALELIRDLEPDIAVLDVNLPEMNGQQITHQVTQEKLRTRILLLTGYDDIEQAIHAAHAGAAAYCAKDIQPQGLVSVIRDVAIGKYVIGGNVFNRRELDEWLESQMEGARRSYSEPGSPFHPLSDREMDPHLLTNTGKYILRFPKNLPVYCGLAIRRSRTMSPPFCVNLGLKIGRRLSSML